MKYAVAESRSISDKVLHWDDEAPSPADVFCLFPLQAAAATSPSPWRTQGASGPLKQEDKLIPKQASPRVLPALSGWEAGDSTETRAAARRGLGRFVIEPRQLLPAAKQTNRKDISREREEVSDLDCAVQAQALTTAKISFRRQ